MELTPDWVVGFVDGEGCFHVSINRHSEMTIGFQVLPEFVVVQHQRDVQVLQALKRFFRAGVVRSNHGDRWCFRVRKLQSLIEICDFFRRHPLKTRKQSDVKKFCRIVRMINSKSHLSLEGLLRIVDIATTMNAADPNRLAVVRSALEKAIKR